MPPAPTVPSRVTPGLGGEAVRAGRFRGSNLSRGLGRRSSGVLPALARLSVSPLAPRQGRSPGGSPLGSSGTGVPDPSCCPAKPPPKHRFRVPAGLPLAEASGLPGSPWTCVLGLPVSQLPGRNPVLPEGSGPKPFLRRWQRADLRPAFCRTGTWTEARRPVCFGSVPEGPGTWALDDACRFRIR